MSKDKRAEVFERFVEEVKIPKSHSGITLLVRPLTTEKWTPYFSAEGYEVLPIAVAMSHLADVMLVGTGVAKEARDDGELTGVEKRVTVLVSIVESEYRVGVRFDDDPDHWDTFDEKRESNGNGMGGGVVEALAGLTEAFAEARRIMREEFSISEEE